MFDIGWGELVVVGIVALIAIGPKELPTVLRTLGQYMGKIKRMSAEFQGQFQEALREAELSDLKKHAEDIQSTVADFSKYDPLENTDKPPAETAAPEALPAPDAGSGLPEETVVTQPVPTETAAAEPAEPLPAIDVPLPELPQPSQEAEPPAQPVQKQA
jgi:sec-independent protein translocase protein TatB